TCGATMTSFLGQPQWGAGGYAPYAILNWLNPMVSILWGFTGFSMEKMTEEEYQRILEAREEEKKAALKSMEA
ncbi:MAG: Na+/H+ antiporter NhaC, partial [Firmicutes bacterium]|nr:Na+/H+ antiporter NhaC [Bacillota bacterium]